MVFLCFLLLATQVLFDLYARSAVGAAAYDGARVLSGSDSGGDPATEAPGQLQAAEDVAGAAARASLGGYGQRARLAWTVTAETVSLAVQVQNPSLLPAVFARPLGIDSITRTAVLRREYVRG